MIKFIKSFFKKKEDPVAPYKVETPVAIGEPPATLVVEGAGQIDVAPVPAKKKPAAKKVKTTKQLIEEHPDYKPEAKTKKPRAPRQPKAE